MKQQLMTVVNVIGWIILLFCFASIGFSSSNPKIMIPAYLTFFVLVFGGVLLYVKKHQRRREVNPETKHMINIILGTALLVVSLYVPVRMFNTLFPGLLNFGYGAITVIVSAVLVALGILGVRLINNSRGASFIMGLLGYVVLIVLAVVPAAVIMQFDTSYSSLGVAYYTALVLAILSWWGISLISAKTE